MEVLSLAINGTKNGGPNCRKLMRWLVNRLMHCCIALVWGLIFTCGPYCAALADDHVLDRSGAGITTSEAPRFVRVFRDARGEPQSLETSVVHLRSAESAPSSIGAQDSFRLSLYSAVHVGEPEYYAELNRRFREYDAVLFELVADPDAHRNHNLGEGGDNPISLLQKGIQNLLKLEYQLRAIDYRASNMVHADMTPEQLSRSMKARNESILTLVLRAAAVSMAKENAAGGKPPDISSLFMLMFDDARAMALRRIMASEFEDMDQLLEALNGPEGSAIVHDRNSVALSKLSEVRRVGAQRVAIFYGGAHMPDLFARALHQQNLRYVGEEWLRAWKLGVREAASESPSESKPKHQ